MYFSIISFSKVCSTTLYYLHIYLCRAIEFSMHFYEFAQLHTCARILVLTRISVFLVESLGRFKSVYIFVSECTAYIRDVNRAGPNAGRAGPNLCTESQKLLHVNLVVSLMHVSVPDTVIACQSPNKTITDNLWKYTLISLIFSLLLMKNLLFGCG